MTAYSSLKNVAFAAGPAGTRQSPSPKGRGGEQVEMLEHVASVRRPDDTNVPSGLAERSTSGGPYARTRRCGWPGWR